MTPTNTVNSSNIPVLLAALLTLNCSNEPQGLDSAPAAAATSSTVDHTPPSAAATGLAGTVVETMDSGGYTYLLIDTGDAKVWAAGPVSTVALGDSVAIMDPMPMPGFHSSTLERDFEMIYFSSSILGAAPPAEVAAAHVGSSAAPQGVSVAAASIEKAEGGQTVEDVFVGKDELVGTTVVIRAKVVKYTPAIMGKNWLHIQDGSGSEGTNDLTVTTAGTAAVGDTVVISGTLVADKDFGFGYEYALMVEDAEVTIE